MVRILSLFGLLLMGTLCSSMSCSTAPGDTSGAVSVPDAAGPISTVEAKMCTENWQRVYLPSIDRQLERSGLAPESESAEEYRFWGVGGYLYYNGFVLRRLDGNWEGHFLSEQTDVNGERKVQAERLNEPQNGWQSLADLLIDEGIRTIPDECEIASRMGEEDGENVIIESLIGGERRAIRYDEPWFSDAPEAKKVVALFDLVRKETGKEIDLRLRQSLQDEKNK